MAESLGSMADSVRTCRLLIRCAHYVLPLRVSRTCSKFLLFRYVRLIENRRSPMMVQCVTFFGPIQTVCTSLSSLMALSLHKHVFSFDRYNWMGTISAGRWLPFRRRHYQSLCAP